MNNRQRKTISDVMWDWNAWIGRTSTRPSLEQCRDHLLYLIQTYGHDLTADERAEVEGELSCLVSYPTITKEQP